MSKGHGASKVKRSSMIAYNRKVRAITKWYNRLVALREKNPIVINENNKQEVKRKELKPLDWYLSKLRKPKGE
jgi:hypothetical protein